MREILKFNVVHHDKVWGNEQWIVSAHENGTSIVKDGQFKGKALNELFAENREIFGNTSFTEFPLLVKIIEANDHLSVQVHPDDEYAKKFEKSLGKNECWYVLDSKENADIVVGHSLKEKNELKKLIDENKLESKLNIQQISKGDFFNVPAGTIHAIRGGTKILEVQQSSDITYRLYDYGRLENGQPRELHIEKSLDVVNFNQYENVEKQIVNTENFNKEILVNNKFFTVEKINVLQSYTMQNKYDFMIGVVLNDSTYINGEKMEKFEGFIVPNNNEIEIEKNSEIYISYIKKENDEN